MVTVYVYSFLQRIIQSTVDVLYEFKYKADSSSTIKILINQPISGYFKHIKLYYCTC